MNRGECGGDTRGLAGLSQEAAEVLEDYFSGWGLPPEKCRLPSVPHQSWKGTQVTTSCEQQQGFCQPGRDS